RERRIASTVFDSEEDHEFVKVKDVLTLKITPGQRQEILAVFYEDTREIDHLTIQRFEKKTGTPHKRSAYSLSGNQLAMVYALLKAIPLLKLPSGKLTIREGALDAALVSEDERRRLLRESFHLLRDEELAKFIQDQPELLREIIQNNITKSDVVALGYRKSELADFERLLNEPGYFDSVREGTGARGGEAVWQNFFERNPWIFGYGLNFIFTSTLNDRKLEQVTTGYDFTQRGKRIDALMKTLGFISSLCFVEIKTHRTDLLSSRGRPYRKDVWPVSEELSGSISQVQKTVQKAIMAIREKAELRGDLGEPTGETVFAYQPKSYVVIGSLDEFFTEHGMHQEKYSSFELFRRQLVNPEIITFDELHQRAKYIVEHTESAERLEKRGSSLEDVSNRFDEPDDEIPF
nr:DUF4263 domain-containing protein [Chloroflexota bacterium]